MSTDPDEDLIEATIRRVAASKAARLPDPVEDAAAKSSRGRAVSSPDLHLVPATGDGAPAARPPADESLIEATLRRIEAQQAARAAEAAESSARETSPEADPSPALHVVRSEDDGRRDVVLSRPAPTAPALQDLDIAPQRDLTDSPVAPSAPPDIAALRRDLDETRQQLRELSERVDSMLASPSAQPSPPRRSSPQSALEEPAALASSMNSDDGWDDPPVIARMDTGLPPRRATIRDPLPGPAATARIEEPSPAAPGAPEARPIAAPPALANTPKRGFDLLPRTYRITVEDKRRGVDLVPLHRALLGMSGVSDMSLLSYSNGTAIVALEATAEVAPDALGAAVSHAMARQVKVEVHNEQTMVIKLAED